MAVAKDYFINRLIIILVSHSLIVSKSVVIIRPVKIWQSFSNCWFRTWSSSSGWRDKLVNVLLSCFIINTMTLYVLTLSMASLALCSCDLPGHVCPAGRTGPSCKDHHDLLLKLAFFPHTHMFKPSGILSIIFFLLQHMLKVGLWCLHLWPHSPWDQNVVTSYLLRFRCWRDNTRKHNVTLLHRSS